MNDPQTAGTAPGPISAPLTRAGLRERFGVSFPIVGMVHLAPLPGSPGWGGSIAAVLERAVADARALVDGGVDGLLVENFGDLPFHPGRVPPETVAAMARAVSAVVAEAGGRPVGVNVLRNDVRSALGVAAACGAAFLRVNVHTGTMFTDQGALSGAAHETMRLRAGLAPRVLVAADVHVKHAVPTPGESLERAAEDARRRGLADLLIVSGAGTGAPTDPERVARVRAVLPDAPLWIGSGLTPERAPTLLAHADGAIVGSALQVGGRAGAGVEVERVERLMEAVAALR